VIYFVIYIYFFLIAKALCIILRSLNFILQVMGKHLIKPVILFIYFGYLFYLAVLGLSCGTWDLSFFLFFFSIFGYAWSLLLHRGFSLIAVSRGHSLVAV